MTQLAHRSARLPRVTRSPLPVTLATLAIALAAAALAPHADAATPAVASPNVASPVTTASDDAAFVAATALFMRAAAGDSSAASAAAAQFGTLARQRPTDPVLTAYAGASTCLLATTTWLPWRKLAHAEDGLALLDKALASLAADHDRPLHRGTPASLETRFVAASTFLRVPAMFNRRDQGEKLLQQVLQSPLLDPSPAPFKAAVWLRAGTEAGRERPAEARQWLQRAAASGVPQPAAAAQAALKELGL